MRFEKEINIYGDEVVLKRFQANETSISVLQGKISALISESELVELENSQATMYSKLASAILDIDSLTLNFSDLTTKYNTVSGQYTSLDSKVAQYKAGVDGLSADITQVSQNLSKNYSTTTQMNAAINAKAGEIFAEVSAVRMTLQNDYSTTTAMNSTIDVKLNQLSLSVSNSISSATGRIEALETWRSEASLKITDSAIISTVTESSTYTNSVNSLIEQKASSIRLRATTISWSSTYSSMTSSGTLTCRNATIEGTIHNDNGNNEIYMRNARLDFIRGGAEIGSIGTNNISGKPATRGLVFDLEYGSHYIAFARKDSSSASEYSIKLGYYPQANMVSNTYPGWYFGEDAYMNGNMLSLDPAGRTWTNGYTNGAGIYTRDTFWIVGDSGNIAQFGQNDTVFAKDIYANVAGTPSDERLKTNIKGCEINALSLIKRLDFKAFDWIESGGHEKVGLIAQDVEKIDPSLVSVSQEIKNINPTRLLWYCAKAIQELAALSGIGADAPKIMAMAADPEAPDMTLEEKKAWIKSIREKYKPIKAEPIKMLT